MTKDDVLVPIRALLTLLFVYASFSKIFDPEVFQRSMYKQPFPHWLSDILMILVPASELVIVAFLISAKRWQLGLKLSLGIMVAFTAYIILILSNAFGHIPCSCGGVIATLNWWQHLIFNIFFLLISLFGVLIQGQVPRDARLKGRLA